MNGVKPFSKQLMGELLKKVDTLQSSIAGPHYAAFDADGTLWDTDVGENFFQYLIDHCNLLELKNIDPWEHYEKLKQQNPPVAYLWLAQLCANTPVDVVRDWAEKAALPAADHVFVSQKELIQELLNRDIHIFIVSASVHWAVEGAAPAIGLKRENALGVKTKVINNLVTREGDGPVTWREGKRLALLEQTKGVRPLLCSGNTSGDVQLLECSQGIALAIQSQLPDSFHATLFNDEQVLYKAAQKNNWYTHSFK
jgi:phosphoserine phosphatase